MSATLPNEVLQMTQQFMTDPVRILVKRDELTLEVRVCVCACVCRRQDKARCVRLCAHAC